MPRRRTAKPEMIRTIEADLGALLRKMREEQRLSQDTVGRIIGVAGAALSLKENGKAGIGYGEAVLWTAALGEPIDTTYGGQLCSTCFDAPPTGFTCNQCGKGGSDSAEPVSDDKQELRS